MLHAYRRHLATCPHAAKGAAYSLCACPIWCDGSVDGRRMRQSLQTSDWSRGQARLVLLARGGVPDAPKAPSLGEAVRLFLADSTARNLRATTLKQYRAATRVLLLALGESVPVDEIAPEQLDSFRRRLQVAASTQARYLETIRMFFRWCQDREYLQRNPASKMRAPLSEPTQTLPFTHEETAALIRAADTIGNDCAHQTDFARRRARAVVLTLLYSGLRISDIAMLRRSALDERGYLTLRVEKTRVPLKIHLHPDAVAALRRMPMLSDVYFFQTGEAAMNTITRSLGKLIAKLGRIAGVENAHPHRFRDTFACELLLTGSDIRTVQKLLGHTSVRTTEKHYAHFVASHQALLDSASARLDFGRKVGPVLAMKRLKHGGRDT